MDRNNLKRKRRDNDDDDVETASGHQILPVATHLPANFNGIPQDGAEYLYTVRQSYAALPRLVVAGTIPAPKPARQAAWVLHAKTYSRRNAQHSDAAGDGVPPNPNVPSIEWKEVFVTRFRRLRENVKQPTTAPEQQPIPRYPKVTDRAGWWSFINGRPESSLEAGKSTQSPAKPTAAYYNMSEGTAPIDNGELDTEIDDASPTGDTGSTPRLAPPTTAILRSFDQKGLLHLLMYFGHWISQLLHPPSTSHPSFPTSPALPPIYAQWIFALLAYLDDRLLSGEIHTLRTLARACGEMLKRSVDVDLGGREERVREEREAAWMVLAAVAGVWGQSDLWEESRAVMLAKA